MRPLNPLRKRRTPSMAWFNRATRHDPWPSLMWRVHWKFRAASGETAFRDGLYSGKTAFRAIGHCLYLMPNFARNNLTGMYAVPMRRNERGSLESVYMEAVETHLGSF